MQKVIKYINIFSYLYFIIIFILQSLFILLNYKTINYQVIPLVITNYMMILPIKKLIQKMKNDKLLLIDLIASFSIHFFSSFYHLCDFSFVNEYCLISPIKWKYLDYYFSYLMVGLGVQHLLFENIPIKILFYFMSIVVQGILIYLNYHDVLLNLSISFIKLGFILIYNIFNKDKLIKQIKKNISFENINTSSIELYENHNLLFINLCCIYYQDYVNYNINFNYLILNFISIFIACLGRFYFINSNYYWWAHSFIWHVFIFLACYFNYSMINYKIKFFISFIKPKKRSKSIESETELV